MIVRTVVIHIVLSVGKVLTLGGDSRRPTIIRHGCPKLTEHIIPRSSERGRGDIILLEIKHHQKQYKAGMDELRVDDQEMNFNLKTPSRKEGFRGGE